VSQETVIKTENTSLSNSKYAWSFVRKKDHLPPAFESSQAQLADKYNAIYLGDTTKKVIYLTFDEGYENGYTPKILDTLKENKVKAAFFITMPYLKNQYDLVDRMVKEGHTVGNHTVNHPSMPEVTDNKELEDEMLVLDSLFKEKTGQQMKYLRPPKGEYSERTLKISKDLGYRNVFWSFAYADWDINNQKGADNAYRMVMDNIHNGAVILLHAVSKDNAEALDRIIKDLKAQGYTFGSLDNL
jgi:peptidoglycan-N-acetylmuramic acid deacetylase